MPLPRAGAATVGPIPKKVEESHCFAMRAARLFKLFMVPGEDVENPGGLPNKNPMDDLNVDLQEWGGRVRSYLYLSRVVTSLKQC